jgi:hypothetical protein
VDRHQTTIFAILVVLGIAAFVVLPIASGFATSLSLSSAARVTVDEDNVPGHRRDNPRAGNWRVVGPEHPGWSAEKWQRWLARHGERRDGCWPPGRCKPGRDQGSDADGG